MEAAEAKPTFPFLSSFRLAAGGLGGAAQNGKEIFWVCPRVVRARPRRRITTQSERTLQSRATTRSARAKWVRAKVSISAQNDTSRAESADEPRAAGAREGRKPRRVATKWLGGRTEKRADLFLVSYPKIIFSKL